ncbi:MAG: hypothetical protein JJE45_00050 [Prolixibacteraceae bacterium]|nr:hypothetical protein [Prolixibacteraceae bacterium]
MTGAKKPGRKPVYIHKCSQKEAIDRMTLILVGNGHPEDGLAFRFNEFMKDHKSVVSDISDIKTDIKKAIESAGTAVHAIEIFKAEETTKDITKDDLEKKQLIADELKARIKKEGEDREFVSYNLKAGKKRDSWQRVIWIITAVFALVSLWAGLYFGFEKINQNQTQIEDKVNNMGIPFVTNSRGEILALPDSTKIMYYPNDSMQYVIKRIK